MEAEIKKRLNLCREERRTLHDMGIYHPHARTRMRAQGMFRLAQVLTLKQVGDEFEVHLNSVENWRQRWDEFVLVGLFEGMYTGRPRKLSDEEQREPGDLACDVGGMAGSIQRLWKRAAHTPLSTNSIKVYLTDMGFQYKRYRLSLKDKRDASAFDHAKGVVASLQNMVKMGNAAFCISTNRDSVLTRRCSMDRRRSGKRSVRKREYTDNVSMSSGCSTRIAN
jgi:transposase